MKNTTEQDQDDDMRPEYDFSKMGPPVRGKYAARYAEGTNLVPIDPEVLRYFKDTNSINEALRMLIKIARTNVDPT